MPRAFRLLSVVLVLSTWFPGAQGQDANRGLAVQGDLGVFKFLEYRKHGGIGGSLRLPFSKRWAFQPEFHYLWAGNGHDDLVLLPNLNFDFLRPPARVRPYVIFGAGLIQVRNRFDTGTTWHISAGCGVKVFLDRRWYVAPDFRIGVEPHARFTVGVGYEFL